MSGNRQLFLSHSSTDAALARRLAVDLIDLGADIWLDQLSLGVGERLLDAIEGAVDRTDLMLVLVSEESLGSGWVQMEWQRLGVAGGNVLPVRLVDCSMPDALASQGFVDLAGGAYWNGVAQIAQRIGIRDARPPVLQLPDVLALPTPVSVELGAAISPVFESMSDPMSPAHVASAELRRRVRARFGLQPPGIRFVGNESDMPLHACQISVEEVPKVFFEVAEAEDVLVTVLGRVEETLVAHLDRFIDPDLCGALYAAYGGGARATTGELTAILREAVRQRLDLADLVPLVGMLSGQRSGPLDTSAVVEELRPHQARRLSLAAASGGDIRALTLDPALERYAESRLQRLSFTTTIQLGPDWAQALWDAIRAKAHETGARTLIVETPVLRPFFERLQMAELTTLARRDLHADVPLRELGVVTIREPTA